MNTHLNTLTALAVAGVMASGLTACAADVHTAKSAEAHPAKVQAAKAKPARASKLKEVTLTGNMTRKEMKVAGKLHSVFLLVTASGDKLRLPTVAKTGKGVAGAPTIKLADFLGQNVKVVAMASEQKKGDKTVVKVRQVKTVEKVPVPAAVPEATKVA